MFKKFIVLITIVLLSVGFAFAGAPAHPSTVRLMTIDKIIGPFSQLPIPDGFFPPYKPADTDDPIGDVFILGTTWYDIQHNSTCGRQVQIDDGGWAHIVWMNGLNLGASSRHIFYQLVDADDSLHFYEGIQVDQGNRGGFTDLALYPDNRAMPCFHQNQLPDDWHTALGFDYFPRTGAFGVFQAPHVYDPYDVVVCWPKIAAHRDNSFHILSAEAPASGVAGDPQRHYYIRAEFDPFTFTINFDPQQTEICWTETISGTVAASPVSDRVAVAYLGPWATSPDTTQHDNNLILVLSDDGLTWDWDDTINVTNWIPPDLSLLPDTCAANRDTFRCYAEISLLFDYNDILHIIFSTEGFYSIEGAITWGNGFIWHWDEYNQVFSVVANGWFDNGFYDPGAWNTYTTRPSAAVDPETGDLYCMYQRYFQPLGPSTQYPYPYQMGDTTDFSQTGYPNGEVWVTKSTNDGWSWAEGTNVSGTASPNAQPGDCQSELTPSMYQEIVDECCHIFYILDKDAGAVVQNEGTWTLNDAVYQRVPIEAIADYPILLPYPMHCDTTQAVEPGPGVRPAEFTLHPPYPNPFNPSTVLSFELRVAGMVKLVVYDVNGREVVRLVDEWRNAGAYEASFEGNDLPSGVYFARLTAGDVQQTQKLLLIK